MMMMSNDDHGIDADITAAPGTASVEGCCYHIYLLTCGKRRMEVPMAAATPIEPKRFRHLMAGVNSHERKPS